MGVGQSLANASSVSGSTWGLLAAVATAVVAIATLVLREAQRRRTDLDQKVANAVDASIGKTLLEYREFEVAVRTTLESTAQSATDIERQLQERLSVSESQAARLGELLDHAADLVPRLESSQSAMPSRLLSEAMRAATPEEALGPLSALLASDEAGADNLELAGDVARQKFGAEALARALYRRAVEINPSRVAAQASLILLETNAGALTIDEGRAQISALAKANPGNRNAISEALNLYATYEDYDGMLGLVDELLAVDDNKAILWRNRAVALSHIGRPSEVEAAYARSYAIANDADDDDERSNTARPYVAFLLQMKRYEDALRILEDTLDRDPEEDRLLLMLGELWDKRGDREKAMQCYDVALTVASNPTSSRIIRDRRQRLARRALLIESGILKDESAGSRRGLPST